jgi:hypothetical protein
MATAWRAPRGRRCSGDCGARHFPRVAPGIDDDDDYYYCATALIREHVDDHHGPDDHVNERICDDHDDDAGAQRAKHRTCSASHAGCEQKGSSHR